ncbi:hypothetical protein VZQ01_19395 [Myxococcus faecalis]|uniref:tetratricopeptide repeat protein n=1 Tax=Myxococcus faecalis TaxID=3115646 RepID=UPI003CF0984A
MMNHIDRVLGALDRGGRAWVMGAPGSGRWELAQTLQQLPERTHLLRLPPMMETDGAVHGLLQAAAVLGQEALSEAAHDNEPLQARARRVAEQLAQRQKTLVVYLPDSWTFHARVKDATGLLLVQRALELLEGLASAKDLRWVVMTPSLPSPRIPLFLSALSPSSRIRLSPRNVSRSVLDDDSRWGDAAPAASRLGRVMGAQVELTEPQLRMMVCLVQMGEDPRTLLRQVEPSLKAGPHSAVEVLRPRFEEVLHRPENQALRRGWHRVLQARFPIPLEEARRLTGFTEERLSSMRSCLGTSADELQVDDGVREWLLAVTAEPEQHGSPPDAHLALAEFHERRDGALSVELAQGQQVLHWLEKVHHLGHSGRLGAERWAKLKLTSREFFWDRARALSIEQRDFMGAADVYERCLEQVDSEDAYSWHYLGFNLDRAAQKRERAEEAFRKAVELDPTNPWWNGRLVTFLIEQSRFRAADGEWEQALERVDPAGTVVREGAALALNMHRWVVTSWLQRGEVARARKAFDTIPLEVVERQEVLKRLRQRLADAEEAVQLGESVYPASVPVTLRWKKPLFLDVRNENGSTLREWFPGRVVHASRHEVQLVVATPEVDPLERQVVSKTLSREQWAHAARTQALPKEDTFIEVGTYEDEALRIVLVPAEEALLRQRPWMDKDSLRYLRRWG